MPGTGLPVAAGMLAADEMVIDSSAVVKKAGLQSAAAGTRRPGGAPVRHGSAPCTLFFVFSPG